MSCSVGPEISNSGLILSLDAKNRFSYPRSGTTWFDLSGNDYHFSIYGEPVFNPAGYFTFANDQVTQYIMRYPFETPTVDITYSCWFRSNFSSANQTPFTYSVNGDNEMLFFINSATQLAPHPKNVSVGVDTTDMTNKWVNFIWSRNASTGVSLFYRDGVNIGQYTNSAGTGIAANGYMIIGQEPDTPGGSFSSLQNLDGDFARFDVWDRVLTASEIWQHFVAFRGRYGV